MAKKSDGKQPTSMITAFIRVTCSNSTSDGIVEYNYSDIENIMLEWSDSCKMTYWFIQHGVDEDDATPHFHIVIRFGSPTPFTNIKAKFPYGKIESARSVKKCVQYLVHQNDLSKMQYSWDNVVTNCQDMSIFKVQNKQQDEVTLQSVIDAIERGEIREYNQFEKIDINIFSKHRTRIENALLYYREKIYMDKNRKIEVVFMSGETGSGKTTFAKQYCQKANKSYCISSSSNDPMQDYKGEDVLILDDLRDSDFKFTDLLKILDNHTKTTMKARYHNKAFIGETIIITSYKRLSEWYHDIERENKEQLYRRIKTQYQFTDEFITIFSYDEGQHKYVPMGRSRNVIKMSSREKVCMGLNMMSAMGIELDPEYEKELKDKLASISDSDLDSMWTAAEQENLPFD